MIIFQIYILLDDIFISAVLIVAIISSKRRSCTLTSDLSCSRMGSGLQDRTWSWLYLHRGSFDVGGIAHARTLHADALETSVRVHTHLLPGAVVLPDGTLVHVWERERGTGGDSQ